MTTMSYEHPIPKPAWAVESASGKFGKFGWTRHDGEPVRLASPDGSFVLAEAALFQFAEDSEPILTRIRIRPEDDGVTDDGEGVELDADQADTMIQNAEQWVAGLRALRAQMGGAP
ncbi:hypothetical protein GXW83_27540 [Streptacidiphilus sp. PB12-B1b]|uniref:DUF6907 domain-containing protein n=1 Tax=Streptacidiphilus sp. PB12-B1b TaxID=2705012 RepID=UPI0015FCC9AB|nr:hypothetical protein [Streptacidiphilus sp. PB12-B1b]QMU78899.1 hypothetical protein GXW83_27540 [Streptacidiphilus sp. PB12-B1b]